MHMADALLSPAVGGAMWAVSAGATVYATKKITDMDLSQKKLPVMAVAGAFVFAAQMINFTIPGTGSSGHICGGIMLAALLGEFPAFLTLASVLIIQCLFFADGGLLALGANIFNMGLIPCLIMYPLIFRPLMKKGISKAKLAGASILCCVLGLQLGAFGVVLETLASGITELPFGTFVAMMQPIHLAIGFVEGLITAAVVVFVWQVRPELVESSVQKEKVSEKISLGKVTVIFAVLSAVVAGGLSLLASAFPDGLEWSMEKVAGTAELEASGGVYGFVEKIQNTLSFMPDYDFAAGTGSGTSVAGIVGALLTCGLAFLTGFIITNAKKRVNGGH